MSNDGQSVIVAARWVLIAVGFFLLTVAPTSDVGELRLQIALILLLALGNFFLNAHLLKRRRIPGLVAYAAAAADLVVITILVLSQPGDSVLYVLYFPALLALSVAFVPASTVFYASGAVVAYWLVAAARHVPAPIVATRALMLAGTAFCGGVYWYVERDRRRRLAGATTSDRSLQ
jgi:hypothetical protein